MLKIISLKEEHLEDAALLVSHHYQRLLHEVPHLPYSYTDVTRLLPLLQKILNSSGGGVAAIQGNRLVGFLTGWQSSFLGKRSTHSPEWANAADLEDNGRIYEESTVILQPHGLKIDLLPTTSACFQTMKIR